MFPSPSSSHSIPKVCSLTWPRLGHVVAIILSWQVFRMRMVTLGIDDWVFVHDHLGVGSITIWFTISFGIYILGLANTLVTVVNPPFIFYEGNSNDLHHPLSTTPKLYFDIAFCEHVYVPFGIMKQDSLETSDMRSVEKLHVISWWPQFTPWKKKNRTRTDVNLPFQCSVFFVP